jgi:prepilin-type N-terminal cleavage/methylation domain-containing protein
MARRGFTLIEVVAVVAVGVAGVCVLRAASGQPEAGAEDPGLRVQRLKPRDASNVRQIGQAMVIWAQNHEDWYPLPSRVELSRFTVAEQRTSADTTANIFSMLVFAGSVKPEVLISPLETNPRIEEKKGYAFKDPPAALAPEKALWDPTFGADFTDPAKKGNVSYAHLMPFGERQFRWTNSFLSSDIQIASRGPEIAEVTYDEKGEEATARLVNPASNTLKFFSAPSKDGALAVPAWAGHLAFADNHVEFREEGVKNGAMVLGKNWPAFTVSEQRLRRDVWSYDEPEDGKGTNTYLGVFTRAGGQKGDWKAIWD